MLGKLMKYEFMALGRVFLPLFGALIVISAVNNVLGMISLKTPAGISLAVAILLMVGVAVITFIIMIQRFWTNLLSNEGYLMMTLPVSADQIILSKLFTASILSVASTIVVALSILIITAANINFSTIAEGIAYVLGQIPFSSSHAVILVIEFLIAVIISMFMNILLLYASMSLSMVANKYRWLVAVGAYLAIVTALQIIFTAGVAIGVATSFFDSFEWFIASFPTFGQIQIFVAGIMIICLALCAAFYIITRYMLKNRLNLQ